MNKFQSINSKTILKITTKIYNILNSNNKTIQTKRMKILIYLSSIWIKIQRNKINNNKHQPYLHLKE